MLVNVQECARKKQVYRKQTINHKSDSWQAEAAAISQEDSVSTVSSARMWVYLFQCATVYQESARLKVLQIIKYEQRDWMLIEAAVWGQYRVTVAAKLSYFICYVHEPSLLLP